MTHSRLGDVFGPRQAYYGEGEVSGFTRPTPRSAVPAGFVPCASPALMMAGGAWPQMIYWMALQQATEVVRPSWTELSLTAHAN